MASGFPACSRVLSHPVHSAHCLSFQRQVLAIARGCFPSARPVTPTKLLIWVMHHILPALSSTGVGARGSVVITLPLLSAPHTPQMPSSVHTGADFPRQYSCSSWHPALYCTATGFSDTNFPASRKPSKEPEIEVLNKYQ